ncbi:MAG: YihY/virulence factor BrkB family protein, partial [Candidatus Binatia bacterium]
LREIADMSGEAVSAWYEDNAMRLAAALAYYTLFSLAPVLVIVTAFAGFVFGDDAVRGQIDDQLRGLIGAEGGEVVQAMVKGARPSAGNLVGLVLSILMMIVGATGVFAELRSDLNFIWRVPTPQTSGVFSLVRDRLLSFAMVLAIGFVLLASLLVNAILVALWTYVSIVLPLHPALLQIVELVVSLTVVSVLFATMFKLLPDAHIPWEDVWVGGALTAILFTAGKTVIGLYLGQSGAFSTFGAAGSIVVLLVWIYYSSTIFFFGAELTKVYAHRHGSRCEAAPVARAPHRMVESHS